MRNMDKDLKLSYCYFKLNPEINSGSTTLRIVLANSEGLFV